METTYRALAINCTLKASPDESNTHALIKKVFGYLEDLGATCDIVRAVDHNLPAGIKSDEGAGDDWPGILKKVKACDIFIMAMPLWMGVRSSVAQRVIERLEGTYGEGDEVTGQYPLYNKVGGCIVTGNEDGAHDAASNTLFNLSHYGCTIPPNCDSYWVGPAGPGPSYIEADGDKHLFTDRTARYMAHNMMYIAKLLRANPIDTNLKHLDAAAKKYCESEA